MGVLAWLLPDEALVLVIAAIGLALMLGFRRVAGSFFMLALFIVVLPVLLPLIDIAAEAMPMWLLLIAGAWLALAIFRSLLVLLIGRHAANQAVGYMAGAAIVGGIRLFFLPLRLLVRGRR